MREVNTELIDICPVVLDRFNREVWLSCCQQDIGVLGLCDEDMTIFIDEDSYADNQ